MNKMLSRRTNEEGSKQKINETFVTRPSADLFDSLESVFTELIIFETYLGMVR